MKEVASTGAKVVARLSFPRIFKPGKGMNDSDEKKYGSLLIIPKSDKQGLKDLNAAIENAIDKGIEDGLFKAADAAKSNFKICLRDGSEKDGDEFLKTMFINANSKQKPGCVDRRGEDVLEEDGVIYAGAWAKVSLNFFPFNYQGSKGIGCGLNNLMFWKDDEPLGGGRQSAKNDFADDLEDEDEAPARSKRKPVVDDDDEDEKPKRRKPVVDEDDDEPAPRRKTAGPVKRPTAKKSEDEDEPAPRKRRIIEDDED